MESIFNFSRINRVSQGGVQIGCSPPWKNFFVKNLKGGTKVKIHPPPLPRFFEKFKRKPQRGYQRIFFGLNLEMFPLVSPLRFQQNFGKNL